MSNKLFVTTDTGGGNVRRENIKVNNLIAQAYDPTMSSNFGFGNGIYMPRLSAPSRSNKYFIHTSQGGYCSAVMIGGTKWCLPNCVGYAWGRVAELCNIWGCAQPSTSVLSINDAHNFWDLNERNKNQGRPYWASGQLPRLGAVACYSAVKHNGDYAAGHVMVVEQIYYKKDGSVDYAVCSSSASGGSWFYTTEIKASKGYLYNSGNIITLQGFLYPPYSTFFCKDAGAAYSEGDSAATTGGCTYKTLLTIDPVTHEYVAYTGPVSNYNPEKPGIPTTTQDPGTLTFKVGDTVKVKGSGNTSKLGTGKSVDNLGAVYIIKSVHQGFPFTYRIGTQNKGIGYYKALDLEVV